jgi:hypothetical protein
MLLTAKEANAEVLKIKNSRETKVHDILFRAAMEINKNIKQMRFTTTIPFGKDNFPDKDVQNDVIKVLVDNGYKVNFLYDDLSNDSYIIETNHRLDISWGKI